MSDNKMASGNNTTNFFDGSTTKDVADDMSLALISDYNDVQQRNKD